MLKKSTLGIVFFIGVFLTFIVKMPASWLASGISSLTSQKVQILNASGTIWNGSGYLQLTGGSGSDSARILPDRINWQLSLHIYSAASKQITPNLALQINQPCCLSRPLKLILEPGFSNHDLYLNDFKWLAPADILAGLGSPWNTLKLQGRLELLSKAWHIKFTKDKVLPKGEGVEMVLTDLQTAISTVKPLGSYTIKLLPDAQNINNISINISTIKGAMHMTGTGMASPNSLSFKGDIYAQPGYQEALGTLFIMLRSNRGPIQFNILPSPTTAQTAPITENNPPKK